MTHAHTTLPAPVEVAPVQEQGPRRAQVYRHAVAAVEQARHFRARLDAEAARAQVLGAVAVRETAAAHAQALAHAEDRLAVVLWDSPVSAALALRDVVVFAEVSPVAAALADRLVARFAGWGVVVEIATGTVALGGRP